MTPDAHAALPLAALLAAGCALGALVGWAAVAARKNRRARIKYLARVLAAGSGIGRRPPDEDKG